MLTRIAVFVRDDNTGEWVSETIELEIGPDLWDAAVQEFEVNRSASFEDAVLETIKRGISPMIESGLMREATKPSMSFLEAAEAAENRMQRGPSVTHPPRQAPPAPRQPPPAPAAPRAPLPPHPVPRAAPSQGVANPWLRGQQPTVQYSPSGAGLPPGMSEEDVRLIDSTDQAYPMEPLCVVEIADITGVGRESGKAIVVENDGSQPIIDATPSDAPDPQPVAQPKE